MFSTECLKFYRCISSISLRVSLCCGHWIQRLHVRGISQMNLTNSDLYFSFCVLVATRPTTCPSATCRRRITESLWVCGCSSVSNTAPTRSLRSSQLHIDDDNAAQGRKTRSGQRRLCWKQQETDPTKTRGPTSGLETKARQQTETATQRPPTPTRGLWRESTCEEVLTRHVNRVESEKTRHTVNAKLEGEIPAKAQKMFKSFMD